MYFFSDVLFSCLNTANYDEIKIENLVIQYCSQVVIVMFLVFKSFNTT